MSSILKIFGGSFVRPTHRAFSTCSLLLQEEGKRPNKWNLPDLDKLPGGFRGKVYNKRDWKEHLSKHTKIFEKDKVESPAIKTSAPPKDWRKDKSLPQYMRTKYALKEKKLKMDLSKTKRLSRDTMESIRVLHQQYPEELTTDKLAEFFKISPVAISKILKSKWTPTEKEAKKKEEKWEKDGKAIIEEKMVEMKLKEFFYTKEKELGLKLPYFFKQELTDFFKLQGFKGLEENFEKLHEARIQKEKKSVSTPQIAVGDATTPE
ncbi:hypothetical protein CANARDRAFT_7130 [[Candida] arabinofermentans NRRL YB-2248]|uniref:Required for respiratory growth protein 9, mitochondrial n=1 Tax=[Candida] arabinofermentans NRRL YB-2248 TaxID=983967 RepID=A0A1E4T1X7_9ASCO|nr:hypothetical protein CANARDRAFT_7130 [[Candida] arabinofermentans NRRL YB-2248]